MPKLTIHGDVLQDFKAASSREWLVTNGIGGYASCSLSGANTRCYHGLLIAALTPPTGRYTLLARLEETATLEGQAYDLAANQYPGAVYPQGYRYLVQFDAYPAPTFRYQIHPEFVLEKRIWMAQGQNTTYIQYRLAEGRKSVALRLSPLVCWKDYHARMQPWAGFPARLEAEPGEMRVQATSDAPCLRLLASGAAWEAAGYWHNNVELVREQERGFDCHEDLYCPGHFQLTLTPGNSITLIATTEESPPAPDEAWTAWCTRQQELLSLAATSDDFGCLLTLAADAFVIAGREEPAGRGDTSAIRSANTSLSPPSSTSKNTISEPASPAIRSTIIAGYHWFADWGRDTMIALPGLCLTTGRAETARKILTAFATFVSEGMLPNRFPDRGETPEYNTADATLWYFQAIGEYAGQVENGLELVRELWPTLEDILEWHRRGTRYGIGVDASDGLLRAGEPGVQLTWMDAKIGDWVVTPRIGKPVEINALWINALCLMETWADRLGVETRLYQRWANQATQSFRTGFVRPDGRGLYDVLGENGPDGSVRPNQIFAVSLPYSPLRREEQQSVVQTVETALLTPCGLRTLAPSDSRYCPRYAGGPRERDSAYHQGTVWPWLLGPFVAAHFKVYGDREKARAFLLPLQAHLLEAGVGSLSEIMDGDWPHAPDGCIAQAWSIAETLRAWALTA